MAARIEGVLERLRRAQAHLDALKKMQANFRSLNPCSHKIEIYREETVRFQVEAQKLVGHTIPYTTFIDLGNNLVELATPFVREFGIILNVRHEPPAIRMGALVGDTVHNLRTALDYIVWELTDKHSGPVPPDPLPRRSPWRQVQFPIALTPNDWTNEVRRLWGINPVLATRFEGLQPFRTHRKQPDRHWLAVLQELWNRDKHRAVAVVNSLVKLAQVNPGDWTWVSDSRGDAPPEKVQGHVVRKRQLGPLEDGAELAHIRIVGTTVHRASLESAMDMNLQFAYDIAFEKGAPGFGRAVIDTLEDLHNRVTAVVVQFEAQLK